MEGKCGYCGKVKPLTIDHFYPQAIYKWCGNEYKKCITRKKNWVYACSSCNYYKQEKIYGIEGVKSLKKQEQLKQVKEQLGDGVEKFTEFKKTLYSNQKGKCYCCGKDIPLSKSTLRRKVHELPRTPDNACLLCFKCNKKHFKGQKKENS